ncbi:hypothetical protein O988_00911 [Pseudogymnoascus sp. VKM F-3808]|nr:hypothetical protein O988_00911 [Pseudogymnoascus sp. VKM F-3808]
MPSYNTIITRELKIAITYLRSEELVGSCAILCIYYLSDMYDACAHACRADHLRNVGASSATPYGVHLTRSKSTQGWLFGTGLGIREKSQIDYITPSAFSIS